MHGFHRSSMSQDENRCYPYGMVVAKEIITKICPLVRGTEREGCLCSWLGGWSTNSESLLLWFVTWWQGWLSGESTCLPPMWPGFDFRTRRQMWFEFVGSLLCYERFFPGYSGFPLSPKTNI